ncbi:MAG: hypothetical protein ACR2QV_10710 [Gammaproteobacteria bacterium]
MKIKTVLGSAAALLVAAGFSGQVSAGGHESAGALSCADIEFNSSITDVLPNANEACLSVIERDGRPFAEFKAEVVRNRGATMHARFKRADGGWTDTYELTPDKSRRVNIGGESIRLRDMQRGQQMNIFLPADRFEIVVADDDDVATEPVTFVVITLRRAPAAPAALPTTAGPLPLIGVLGSLFLALGAGIAMLRRRIRS